MPDKKTNSDELGQFVDQLIKDKELEQLDEEIISGLKSDLRDRVEDRINAVILANIPPEKLEYFEQLLDRADQKEIQGFCQRNIFGLDQIIAKELADFRATYLNA